MKPIYAIMTLMVLMLAVILLGGCGHQPMGTTAPTAILGQVESYATNHYYAKGAFVITVNMTAPQTAGATEQMDENGLPILQRGIGNGSFAFCPGWTVWGYQGSKAPKNTPTIKTTPEV